MGQGAPRALRVAVLVSAAVAWESDVRSTTTTHAVGSAAVPAAAEVLARRFASTSRNPNMGDSPVEVASAESETAEKYKHLGNLMVPIHIDSERGGGAPCVNDIDCGWVHPAAMARSRVDLPSGNGAKCLVGRCVCASQYENKFGCPRCNMAMKLQWSYGDGAEISSTMVWTKAGAHLDVCDVPVGGAECQVGRCARDAKNKTVECPGDSQCDAAGSGSGLCVGPDFSKGKCRCAQGFYCEDCSLHERDLIEGAKCDKYISGGAFCVAHTDCSGDGAAGSLAGYCAAPAWSPSDVKEQTLINRVADRLMGIAEPNRNFCKCTHGWTCRRCEKKLADIASGKELCDCDAPMLFPNGGRFNSSWMEVLLTDQPWDSNVECELLYQVMFVDKIPAPSPWGTHAAAVQGIMQNGTRLHRHLDGAWKTVELTYDHWRNKDLQPDEMGRFPPQVYYIYAITVPRPNSTWKVRRSRLIRSKAFVMSVACPRLRVLLAALLAVMSASRGARSSDADR
mmetsp:Transcript_74017/g.216854  ORF Transcript_74017/g.216854 Transcript_74017/m.216854 type:complete len:509 (-) Transcript_74017:86-1612(-)